MSDLYDTDFHEWAETQAALLRSRSANALDWDNLAEEIESLARSDEREVASRLLLICQHLLKWSTSPGAGQSTGAAPFGSIVAISASCSAARLCKTMPRPSSPGATPTAARTPRRRLVC
jgi:hypothetical protein